MAMIYDIDFVLFQEHDIPFFDLRSSKKKKLEQALAQRTFSLPQSQLQWNKLDRISSMMFPKLTRSEYEVFITESTSYQICTIKVNS
jgi:hypothetical protein